MTNGESPLNQSERVAVSLAALRIHQERPMAERFAIIGRALKTASVAAALAVVMSGCGRAAPTHFSIDDGFSAPEADTIRAAVGAWCDAAGWCPTEVLWAEHGRFELVDTLGAAGGCAPGFDCRVGGTNDGSNVLIARDRAGSLDALWFIAAHEAGHYCAEHQPTGLMAAVHNGLPELRIDEAAVEAWLSGCHY